VRPARVALGALVAMALLAGAACSDDSSAKHRDGAGDRLHLPVDYEAMGDSYSSGAGAPPYEPAGRACFRSPQSWSRRLATDSPAGIDSIFHVACGGATAVDLLTTAGTTTRAQLPATPRPAIDLVTLTVGGNDVGFGTILARCLVFRCPKPDDRSIRDALEGLRTNLVDKVYPALRTAFPNAQIVHVGYPRITPGKGARIVGCSWLSGGDRTAGEGIIAALDDTIRDATEQAKVGYIDVFDALAGHEMCTSDPWMVPLGQTDGAHPTAKGYAAIERVVAEALGLPLQP
jgi:lysophospholipase L1-like esterase